MDEGELRSVATGSPETETYPLLFVGHGNPMNAIVDSEYARQWRAQADTLPTPRTILCISAHWQTRGTFITGMEHPRTIHDFTGFPRALYDVEYPAPGNPPFAKTVAGAVRATSVAMDHEWGLDHGTWSVLRHMYPSADVPVVQMSLDQTRPASWHYELGKELASLRKRGVLIVGSGNIVHNLMLADWNTPAGFPWADEADRIMTQHLVDRRFDRLIGYQDLGAEVALAVPTPEHYLPLLYVLGAAGSRDRLDFFNEKRELGSVSMTSIRLDPEPR
jgi:4,5-DOPA dioxygenase extradiol